MFILATCTRIVMYSYGTVSRMFIERVFTLSSYFCSQYKLSSCNTVNNFNFSNYRLLVSWKINKILICLCSIFKPHWNLWILEYIVKFRHMPVHGSRFEGRVKNAVSFGMICCNSLVEVYLWRVLSSGLYHHVVCWKSTRVSEEYVTSIFRAEQ
jgi:hypothetical protein